MQDVEIRELRYFAAVAEELHFGRAAERLWMSQPPLSRAVQRLGQRLGVDLFRRDRRGVRLTSAGEVLLEESRNVFDALAAAVERSRRTVDPDDRLVLVTKAGASHELLRDLLVAYEARAGARPVEVLLCEVGEQRQVLRQGRADAALVHRPYDVLGELETEELVTEGQVAIVPKRHPLALRAHLSLAEVAVVPDPPIARWPRRDGSYPLGPSPEVRTQSEIAQLVSLGRALLVIPESSRAWQWPDHVAVPVFDAPLVTTLLAWPASTRSARIDGLLRAAAEIAHRVPDQDDLDQMPSASSGVGRVVGAVLGRSPASVGLGGEQRVERGRRRPQDRVARPVRADGRGYEPDASEGPCRYSSSVTSSSKATIPSSSSWIAT